MRDDAGTLSEEQLDYLARYFNEEVTFSRHIGAKVERVKPGYSVILIDVEDYHLNGAGTLHGGVCATLLGTGLVAGGASAFNQVLERDSDALMRRTRLRPLPDQVHDAR